MQVKIFIIPLFLSLSISTICIAEPIKLPKPKQVSQSTPLEEDDPCSGSSNFEQVQCLNIELKKQDQELNHVYKLAIAALPEKDASDRRKERHQLVLAQRAWLKYRDEHCTFVGSQEGGNNLWVTHFALICVKTETAERIKFLKGIGG